MGDSLLSSIDLQISKEVFFFCCLFVCLFVCLQTPPEYLRLVAALISSSGKTPVLTPPTPLTTCGLHVLLSHWTLAVSLTSVYRGNISPVKVDNILKDAGYSKGPFQTMNEVFPIDISNCLNFELLAKMIGVFTVHLAA